MGDTFNNPSRFGGHMKPDVLPARSEDEGKMWVRELLAAGWKKHSSTVWIAPNGLLYRGPYKAWAIMKGVWRDER